MESKINTAFAYAETMLISDPDEAANDINNNDITDHIIFPFNFPQNSYGILMDEDFLVLAHPNDTYIGRPIRHSEWNLSFLIEEMLPDNIIFGSRIFNYLEIDTYVFFHQMNNGGYLCLVIPVREYNRNIYNLIIFISLLSSFMAALLCFLVYNVAESKKKSDMRSRQKSNFLATMSHEIRTPLNAILGMTEIQIQNTTLPPAAGEAFIMINNSGNLLLNIINDVLDLSKIEAGELEYLPVKYDVASLINDIVQLNYIRYENKTIEFDVDADQNIPSVLIGDELRIKQVLNNLLSNAFKYTDKGSVTLSAKAECVARGGAVRVTLVFKIIDTGQGMSQEQINRLFDDYSRFNLDADRTTIGSGLGMTITRKLVDLMQGQISVKSEVNKGTTVTVHIPQKTDGVGIGGVIGKDIAESLKQFHVSGAVKRKRTQVKHEYMPYGNILIVDDVETNLYVAKGLMVPYGLKIDLAASGFEAIDKIKEGNVYDVIFMDHMMPKLDGIEATKRIRNMGYNHPVVALTANALSGQAEVFLNNGFDGFISKPIDIRQLNSILNKMIRDKQPSDVLKEAQQKKAEFDKKNKTANLQVDSQLAAIFARDAGKAFVVLENALQNNFKAENDMLLYVINVHAMKSALANIGELELSVKASRLEQAGREKDINVITSETQSFLDELSIIIDKNKPKQDENELKDDTEETLIFLREKLIVISNACADFDKKTIKNTLGELREKQWSQRVKELIDKIAEHLLHSEFDIIAALAGEQKVNNEG